MLVMHAQRMLRGLHSNSKSAIRFRKMGYVVYSNSTLRQASRLTYIAQYRAAIAKNRPSVHLVFASGEKRTYGLGAFSWRQLQHSLQ